MPPELSYFFGLMVSATILVLAAHGSRARLTMAPLYAIAGILTMLIWQIVQLGWWVSWGGLQVDAARLALIPPLMMGMVLAYAMDGIRATRAYLVVVVATSLIAWSFAEFRDALATQVPIPYVFSLSSRAYAGLLVGVASGALLGVLGYEGSIRIMPRPLALGVAVMLAGIGELIAGSLISYGPRTGWVNARQQSLEYLVLPAPPALLVVIYGLAVLRRRGMLPARPLAEAFQFWRSAESNLREAREDVLAAHQVISELRGLNYALAEAKRVNDYLLSHSPRAIVQSDRNGTITFANAAAGRLFSTPAEELEGQSVLAMIAGQGGPLESLEPLAAVTEGRTVLVRPGSPDERVGELLVMDLFDARGQPAGFHISVRDVTAAVRARNRRAVEDKVRGIHRTGQVIAHDFAHLLLGLQGAVERAARSGDRGELERACDAVHRSVAHGRELLRQLGAGDTFSKPFLASAEVGALLEEAVGICRAVAIEKGVCLAVEGVAAGRINVDKTQMVQVLTNLIRNAIRATPQGGSVTLGASIERAAVTIEVRDDGVGMSPQQIELAFDPAFSTKQRGGGGLGLAISYLMVEAHGGSLRLRRNPGGGMTASVWLPLAPERAATIGEGALLVAVEDERLAEELVRGWEEGGGVAAEVQTLDELRAVLHDEPGEWDLLVTDRGHATRVDAPGCTVIHLDGERGGRDLVRAGARSPEQCADLLRWIEAAGR